MWMAHKSCSPSGKYWKATVKQTIHGHTTYEKLASFSVSVLEGFFSADICKEKYWFFWEPGKEVSRVLTWQRVVCRSDVQRWCIGDTGHMVAFLPLPVAEPHHQTEHGHDEQQQEDDAQDGAGRLALWGKCWTDLGVRVQFLHHQGRWGAQQASYWWHIQSTRLL